MMSEQRVSETVDVLPGVLQVAAGCAVEFIAPSAAAWFREFAARRGADAHGATRPTHDASHFRGRASAILPISAGLPIF
jgi:hypothetical protein